MTILPIVPADITPHRVGPARLARLLLPLALLASSAWAVELATVLENTTVTPPDRVGFREERHNPMLKEPLVLTGHLEYLRAGVLRKVIETPFAEAFLIEADQVVIERDGQVRKLPLKKSRSLQSVLGSIEAILSGQVDKLEADFDYQLGGTAEAWSVVLTPLSRGMRRHLTSLQVTGNDQSVTRIRIDLKGGEWHVMDIVRNEMEP